MKDVVSVGIGGSFLGPLFVHTALQTGKNIQPNLFFFFDFLSFSFLLNMRNGPFKLKIVPRKRTKEATFRALSVPVIVGIQLLQGLLNFIVKKLSIFLFSDPEAAEYAKGRQLRLLANLFFLLFFLTV